MDSVDARYQQKITAAYADSTSKNFCKNWVRFMNFYAAHKIPLYPPCPVNVARYVTVYSDQVGAYGTVNNLLSSIKKFYELSGYTLDTKSPVLDMLLKACKRTMSSVSKPKNPIEVAHILLIKNLIDVNNSVHNAFFAALVIQFFSTVRISNLLPVSSKCFKSNKHLKRSDIVHVKNALVLTLPWSKTLQNSDNIFTVPIAENPNSVLDPVAIYLSFMYANPVPSYFPAFTYCQGNMLYILTQSVYIDYLKHFLSMLGFDPTVFSSHSVRRGSASFLFQCGVKTELLKNHGTWKSHCYSRYLQYNFHQKLLPTQAMNDKINDMFGQSGP